MKLFALTILILVFFTNCKRCDSGDGCCNSETSTLYVSGFLKEWIPYEVDDNYTIFHEGSVKTFKIESMALVDTTVYQGDECPDRPAQMIFGKAVFGSSDTISFSTYHPNVLLVEVDSIKFQFSNPTSQYAYTNYNTITSVEYFNELMLDNILFQEVVLAKSESGKISKVYMAKNVGIVAIEKLDTLFVKQ